MKVATTILVFSVIVCSTQVEASWFDSAKESVASLGKSINDNVSKTTDMLQDGLNKAKEQAEQAAEKLQEAAEKVTDKVKEAANGVQESVDKQVNELAEEAESKGTDVSECRLLLTSIRESISKVVKDTVSCLTDTIKNAKDAVTSAISVAYKTLKEVQELRKKAEECTSGNAEGYFARVTATACLTTINTKTAWAVSTGVPSVIKNLITATSRFVTLPPTLNSCISKTAIDTLVEQSRIVVTDVKECIAEKTGKKIEKKESTKEEEKSEENKETVAQNPLSWLKSKLL